MPRATTTDISLTKSYIPKYSQETEGPYSTDLPTPDDIRRLLELERVMVDCTIKSQIVTLTPNQILTKELSPDTKQWEELIREKYVLTRDKITGPSPPCLSCSTMFCTSSHQHDDDDDDDDVETSRASTPSPTTYLNSLDPLNYQNYQMPSSSERTDETLFERQIDLLNQMQQMHKEMRGGFKSFGKALK
ncbi:hypothetical protein Tco_0317026 [Tanacetum coccineum]